MRDREREGGREGGREGMREREREREREKEREGGVKEEEERISSSEAYYLQNIS